MTGVSYRTLIALAGSEDRGYALIRAMRGNLPVERIWCGDDYNLVPAPKETPPERFEPNFVRILRPVLRRKDIRREIAWMASVEMCARERWLRAWASQALSMAELRWP